MIPLLSVIIPVFRESAIINPAVDAVLSLRGADGAEILVVDGEHTRGTLSVVAREGVRRVASPRGRAVQMNAGARLARGRMLLFLHADTRLPANAIDRIREVASDAGLVGGAFDLGIASPRRIYRVVEFGSNLRNRLSRVPYGDQAIFLRRPFFCAIGGFREMPLMEDVDLMLRVRRSGARIRILSERVRTSARRWESDGVVYGTLRNWSLRLLYACGVAPETLALYYHDSDG